MPNHLTLILILLVILVIVIPNSPSGGGVFAFGAGNIPGFAYLEGRAFRHGDIEDVLEDLFKRGAGAGLLARGASKFGGLDIKRVYFGNWLRDYSQAMDVAAFKQLQKQTILNLVMVLGFLGNGYATGAFEVTEERLGVYLPIEHIDNPKGYCDGEDARNYHPKLRGPVQPIEYAVDLSTGMKNYIANESGGWANSKTHVRNLLDECIRLGRLYRSNNKQEDKFEAYRLLGSALHTLEDFAAHSNFCELALIQLGYRDVFPHVGARTMIQSPRGMVYPLVTGTFGGSDFIHSLLGEAADHISSASVSDLNQEIANAKVKQKSQAKGTHAQCGSTAAIKELLGKVPGLSILGGNSQVEKDMDNMDRRKSGGKFDGKNPEEMTPQEMRGAIWSILTFRDNLVMQIEKIIEAIPGLQEILDSIMESISVYIFTTLEPLIKPLMQSTTSDLHQTSAAVINNHDQYEVFNDPYASDPTHSFLSKDHFGLILNEPAGNLAKIVVKHAVPLIIQAWDDTSVNVRGVTEDILQCLFHPAFQNPQSKIQAEMLGYMQIWINAQGHAQHEVVRRLSKESVRSHQNIRFEGQVSGLGDDHGVSAPHGYSAPGGTGKPAKVGGVLGMVPGVNQGTINQATTLLNQMGISTPGLGKKDKDKKDKKPSLPPTSSGFYQPPSGPPSATFGGYGGEGGPPSGGYAVGGNVPGGGYSVPNASVPAYSNAPAGGYTSYGASEHDHGGKKKDKKDKDKDKDKDKKDKKDKKKDKKDKSRGKDDDSEDEERSYHHGGYQVPSGPPPQQQGYGGQGSGFYQPPSHAPPSSTYMSMPSGPGSAPSFPSSPSFGGAPSFPGPPAPGYQQQHHMPNAFPGAPSGYPGGGGYNAPPGGPPGGYSGGYGAPPGPYSSTSGPPPGGMAMPNPGGYPGVGHHHQEWSGSSGGWS